MLALNILPSRCSIEKYIKSDVFGYLGCCNMSNIRQTLTSELHRLLNILKYFFHKKLVFGRVLRNQSHKAH